MKEKLIDNDRLLYSKKIKQSKVTKDPCYLVLDREDLYLFLPCNQFIPSIYRVIFGRDNELLYLQNNKAIPIDFEHFEDITNNIYLEYKRLQTLENTRDARTMIFLVNNQRVTIEYDVSSDGAENGKPSHFWITYQGNFFDCDIIEQVDGSLNLEIRKLSQFRIPGEIIFDNDLAKIFLYVIKCTWEELMDDFVMNADISYMHEGHPATYEEPATPTEYTWKCWSCHQIIEGEPKENCRCPSCLKINYLETYREEYW